MLIGLTDISSDPAAHSTPAGILTANERCDVDRTYVDAVVHDYVCSPQIYGRYLTLQRMEIPINPATGRSWGPFEIAEVDMYHGIFFIF